MIKIISGSYNSIYFGYKNNPGSILGRWLPALKKRHRHDTCFEDVLSAPSAPVCPSNHMSLRAIAKQSHEFSSGQFIKSYRK
jgi:hypothetical protein